MNIYQFRSLATAAVLWLILGAGCHKDPSDLCKNGECCGLGKVEFVRRVEGVRGEWGPGAFAFQELLAYNQHGALTCPTQEEMYKALNLKTNTMYDIATHKVRLIDSTHAYPYRVWGTIYNVVDMPGIAGPTYAIRLDKVEPVY